MKEFFRGFLLVAAVFGCALALWPSAQNLIASRSQATLRAQWTAQHDTQKKLHQTENLKKSLAHGANSPAPKSHTSAPAAQARAFPASRLLIRDVQLDTILVGGIGNADLRRGPGWMPGTALPGERGNCVIAGHRNIYGSPFMDLDRLQPGSEIEIETPDSSFRYTVVALSTASDNDRTVTAAPADNSARLTLVTCTVPKTSYRLIVSAIRS